jgi:single-strand DNA-binding protein
MVGDPVIVYGQIYTRDWVDSDGTKRTLYEMQALAVGHNLARGRARFARNKPVSASEVEPDPSQPIRLGGELTEPAPEQRIGMEPGDPLQHLDDTAFTGALGFEDPFGALDAGIEGRAGGFGRDLASGDAGADGWGAGLDPAAAFLRLDRETDTDTGGDTDGDGEDALEIDGEDADDEDATEDGSADDAETQETEEVASAQAKTRRRRRTPAGV